MTINPESSSTSWLGVLALVLLLLGGCGAESGVSEQAQDDSPRLPGVDTLVVDLARFTQPVTRAAKAGGYAVDFSILASTAHTFAALNVGTWNLLLTVGLAIPVAAFVESFNHPAIPQADGRWIRSYSVTVNNVLHTAQLEARVEQGQVFWDMFVSRQGQYSRFNWFSGESDLDASQGRWTINKDPSNPVALLAIDWHKDHTSNTGGVRYENIEPGSVENGGYIDYGRISGSGLDTFYDIYNKGQDNLVEIEWNSTVGDGRVRNQRFFGDVDWHYWDADFEDVPAP